MGTAKRNFNQNREHFVEGVDFFSICADEFRSLKIGDISPMARENVNVFTESGYLMLVKSLLYAPEQK